MVVTGVMTRALILAKMLVLLQQADSNIKSGSSQADTQSRAGDLQRANGHVEYISDLFPTFSALNQIFYLLKPFRRKRYRPTTSGQRLRVELCLRFHR